MVTAAPQIGATSTAVPSIFVEVFLVCGLHPRATSPTAKINRRIERPPLRRFDRPRQPLSLRWSADRRSLPPQTLEQRVPRCPRSSWRYSWLVACTRALQVQRQESIVASITPKDRKER